MPRLRHKPRHKFSPLVFELAIKVKTGDDLRVAGSSPARFTTCFCNLQVFLSQPQAADVAKNVATHALHAKQLLVSFSVQFLHNND